MSFYSHVEELAKVNFVNVLALVISLSEFEQSVRIFSCAAAGVYTIVKIVQTIQQIKNKTKGDE